MFEANVCPCCGLHEHNTLPGGHSVCPICMWEDDRQQREDENLAGGANDMSLNQARAQFALSNDKYGRPLFENLCLCCGRHTFRVEFETCPVCGWQQDSVQEKRPTFSGGSNKLCLDDYRKAWSEKSKDLTQYITYQLNGGVKMVNCFAGDEVARNLTALDKWGEQLQLEAQFCEKLALRYGIGVPAGVGRIMRRTADCTQNKVYITIAQPVYSDTLIGYQFYENCHLACDGENAESLCDSLSDKTYAVIDRIKRKVVAVIDEPL